MEKGSSKIQVNELAGVTYELDINLTFIFTLYPIHSTRQRELGSLVLRHSVPITIRLRRILEALRVE